MYGCDISRVWPTHKRENYYVPTWIKIIKSRSGEYRTGGIPGGIIERLVSIFV